MEAGDVICGWRIVEDAGADFFVDGSSSLARD